MIEYNRDVALTIALIGRSYIRKIQSSFKCDNKIKRRINTINKIT